MAKKRGLGKGLNALLGSAALGNSDSADTIPMENSVLEENANLSNNDTVVDNLNTVSSGIRTLAVDQIQRGKYQPRVHFDNENLQELADSITQKGMIQPVLVREVADGFELIAGERRWRAAQLAELHEIPVIVKEYTDEDVAAVSLIENIQREDLNPLEEARALSRLQEEFSMTHKSVAEAVGKSRAAVSNLLRLLELNDDVKQMLETGQLEMGHARALLGANESDQTALAKQVIEKGLSVRAVEGLVKSSKEKTNTKEKSKTTKSVDPDIQALEHRLSDTFGAKVGIKHKNTGGGKVEVHYSSLDELEGILAHIN